jgi:hypothetical protein
MTDLRDFVSAIRRPRLLIRAARFGQIDYNRKRDLARLMRQSDIPAPEQALAKLLEEESLLEQARRAGAAHYSFLRHIDILIAMMAELRLLPVREARG